MGLSVKNDLSQKYGCCPVEINAEHMILDPAGIAYWPDEQLLMVADLHLEKGSSFARKGQLLPPYDSAKTLYKLNLALDRWNPRRVIALGDSFHDGGGSARLTLPLHAQLEELMHGRDWVWIAGNHDPLPPAQLGGVCVDELRIGQLILRHEPDNGPSSGEIAGHLHPKARLVRKGRNIRRPCFIADNERMILPSFGAYTGGLDISHPAFLKIFRQNNFWVFMLGDQQIYRISASALR